MSHKRVPEAGCDTCNIGGTIRKKWVFNIHSPLLFSITNGIVPDTANKLYCMALKALALQFIATVNIPHSK